MDYKILIYTRILFLSLILWGTDLINWRDALFIMIIPVTLYYRLVIYILTNTENDELKRLKRRNHEKDKSAK